MRTYHTVTTSSGVKIKLRVPRTQAQLVALDLALMFKDIEGVQEMLRSCVIEHDAMREYGGALDGQEMIDTCLTRDEAVGLARTLCELTCPPVKQLHDVANLSFIIHDGACACRICQGRIEDRKPSAYELGLCRFTVIPSHAFRLYNLTSPHRSANLLHEQPALTAIYTAIRLGESRAVRAARNRQAAHGKVDAILDDLGI